MKERSVCRQCAARIRQQRNKDPVHASPGHRRVLCRFATDLLAMALAASVLVAAYDAIWISASAAPYAA